MIRLNQLKLPVNHTEEQYYTGDGMGEQVAARFPWGYSSVGRAPALQAGGQGFESLYLHDSHEQCLFRQTGSTQARLRESMNA